MKTQVSIRHHDYPSRVRQAVEERLQQLVKYFDRAISMRALLERQNEEHRVEIITNVGNGTVLVADARGDAFSTTLEEAVDRMRRLLKRHNEKLSTERRRGARAS